MILCSRHLGSILRVSGLLELSEWSSRLYARRKLDAMMKVCTIEVPFWKYADSGWWLD